MVDKVAAGITLVGSKECQAKDATNNWQKIHFDYAADKPIYVRVDLRITDEWNYDSGADEVKETIADYINSLLIGSTVYLTKIYPAVYEIPGVGEARVQIGTSKDKLADNDIATQPYEAVSCDVDNIEVNINGL